MHQVLILHKEKTNLNTYHVKVQLLKVKEPGEELSNLNTYHVKVQLFCL